MQTLLDNLTSIQWWLGVVFVGITINLFTIFIKNRLDKYLKNISVWWRNRSEKRKSEFESNVNILKNNPQELVMASFLKLEQMNQTIIMLLISLIFFTIGLILHNIIGQKYIQIRNSPCWWVYSWSAISYSYRGNYRLDIWTCSNRKQFAD